MSDENNASYIVQMIRDFAQRRANETGRTYVIERNSLGDYNVCSLDWSNAYPSTSDYIIATFPPQLKSDSSETP